MALGPLFENECLYGQTSCYESLMDQEFQLVFIHMENIK